MRSKLHLILVGILAILVFTPNTFAQDSPHIRTLTGHTSSVYSVAFSPNGNKIASSSSDRTVRLWDANTGQNIRTLTGHTG